METTQGTLVPQNNFVKLVYFEGDFRSRHQIREILAARHQLRLDRARAYQKRRNRKRKPILFFGLNTTKA